MKQLNPYVTFYGQCSEALHFYEDCFGGEIVSAMTFEGSPVEVPFEYQSKIMHAEFKADDIYFMASDGMPGQTGVERSNIAMSINFSDSQEQAKVFAALAEEGTITMPLEATFWGATFGMVTDKFGVEWMLNCKIDPA